MIYKKGDLLEGKWDVAMHCANLYCVMGSGIAYFLQKKWPEVLEADLDYQGELNVRDSDWKLGTFSKAILEDGRSVYNLYGQRGVGNDGTPIGRNCSYDHLYDAIYRACEDATKLTDNVRVGIPMGMASVRAGGSWLIVDAILADIEEKLPVTFIVYDIENGELKVKDKMQSSVYIPL